MPESRANRKESHSARKVGFSASSDEVRSHSLLLSTCASGEESEIAQSSLSFRKLLRCRPSKLLIRFMPDLAPRRVLANIAFLARTASDDDLDRLLV